MHLNWEVPFTNQLVIDSSLDYHKSLRKLTSGYIIPQGLSHIYVRIYRKKPRKATHQTIKDFLNIFLER